VGLISSLKGECLCHQAVGFRGVLHAFDVGLSRTIKDWRSSGREGRRKEGGTEGKEQGEQEIKSMQVPVRVSCSVRVLCPEVGRLHQTVCTWLN